MDPSGLSSVPASPNMLSGVTDWGRGWEISGGDLILYVSSNKNDGFKIRGTDPHAYTAMTLDSGAKGYGGGGAGSRSGAGSGNNDPKGASNNSHPGVDWDRIQEGFEAISEVGSWLEISGYVGAPFTEGATLAMSAVGEVFQNVGVFGSASIDVFVHGRYEKASIDISFHLLTGGLGHAIPGARESFRYAAGNIILSQF